MSYNKPSGLITTDIHPSCKHVHQICHVILHFFLVGPINAKQTSAPATILNFSTLSQEQNLSLILFIFIHPLFFQIIVKVQFSYASTLLLLLLYLNFSFFKFHVSK